MACWYARDPTCIGFGQILLGLQLDHFCACVSCVAVSCMYASIVCPVPLFLSVTIGDCRWYGFIVFTVSAVS